MYTWTKHKYPLFSDHTSFIKSIRDTEDTLENSYMCNVYALKTYQFNVKTPVDQISMTDSQ